MRYLLILVFVALSTPASAELVVFSSARSMSVASHRVEGDRVIVKLRGGGEMTFDRSLVTSITTDEVPHIDETAMTPNQASLQSIPSRGLIEKTSYDAIIESASEKHDVDARLVKAVIQVESSFEPRARSPKGAMGLMQLMPATARQYRARRPYDPASNIDAGTRYLSKLLTEFELPLALAAYNAGEGAVRRFGGIPPYAETQAYVAKILGLLR
ncbi:MAG TPA: lytic transglycosylase domain-containing protein [Vicinamibacterales bacterium]|nr:lytic transglycosylase domain-containing protein [Vicinamibacterales bacterium]